ncbi:MAG TPA: acyltransferase [Flavisolibacter sp.]|nr:acyltransferase [Flavisolibacter sp.]
MNEMKRGALPGLDHLRALAITMVFLFHYQMFGHPEWIETVGKFGWTGVDLFFVLSGFLISSQLFRQMDRNGNLDLRNYFIKRTFRILPAFLVVLTLYMLWPGFREREAPAPLWKYLTFTQNLGLDLRHQGTFSHAWSLCIEEQFYLALPFALLLLLRKKWIHWGGYLLVALFLLGFLMRFACWKLWVEPYSSTDAFGYLWYRHIYYPTYNRLDGLLAGISLAATFHYFPALRKKIERKGPMLLAAALLVLTGAFTLCSEQTSFQATVFGFPLVAIGYMLLTAAFLSEPFKRYGSRLTSWLAGLSYSIYLVHKAVIHLIQKLFDDLYGDIQGTTSLLLSVAATLIAAWILRRMVEKPFLRWRDKLLRKPASDRKDP